MGKKKIAAKDIALEFVTGGLPAVEKLDKEVGGLSRAVLRGAMKHLKKRESDFKDLEKWCRKRYGFGLENRVGLRAPKKGETRRYKVQSFRGGPFMKLPLHTLDADKGGFVKTHFEDDRIIVTKG